jgi:hypothetical protein
MDKRTLNGKTHQQLVELVLDLQKKLDVVEGDSAYWKMKWRDLVELDENDNVVAIVTPSGKVPIDKQR